MMLIGKTANWLLRHSIQPASEMTYTVPGGALNSTQTKPNHSVQRYVKSGRLVCAKSRVLLKLP